MATLLRTQAIPLGDYPSGTRVLPETAVPDAATVFYMEIARCTTATPTIWPDPATTLAIDLELSLDNGATWRDWAQFADAGSIVLFKDGVTEKMISPLKAPLEPGTNRKIRGTTVITNGPLRTQGFYEART